MSTHKREDPESMWLLPALGGAVIGLVCVAASGLAGLVWLAWRLP